MREIAEKSTLKTCSGLQRAVDFGYREFGVRLHEGAGFPLDRVGALLLLEAVALFSMAIGLACFLS